MALQHIIDSKMRGKETREEIVDSLRTKEEHWTSAERESGGGLSGWGPNRWCYAVDDRMSMAGLRRVEVQAGATVLLRTGFPSPNGRAGLSWGPHWCFSAVENRKCEPETTIIGDLRPGLRMLSEFVPPSRSDPASKKVGTQQLRNTRKACKEHCTDCRNSVLMMHCAAL